MSHVAPLPDFDALRTQNHEAAARQSPAACREALQSHPLVQALIEPYRTRVLALNEDALEALHDGVRAGQAEGRFVVRPGTVEDLWWAEGLVLRARE